MAIRHKNYVDSLHFHEKVLQKCCAKSGNAMPGSGGQE